MARPSRPTGRRRNLLIELGTEELPPKSLGNLSRAFSGVIFDHLVSAGVVVPGADRCRAFATPRRLGVWVKGVAPQQPDKVEERRGPALAAAFDQAGNPTQAAEGFARSCGVSVARLKRIETDKGAWLSYSRRVRGEPIAAIVTQALQGSVNQLPIPKRMRWGDNDVEFVRPVHWLLALYGSDLLKTEVLGLKSNRFTRGHRFHAPGEIRVLSADRYQNTLKSQGFVVADFEQRKAMISKQAVRLVARQGEKVVMEDALLEEVTGLVEWPVAHLGEFDAGFLKLPREVLVSTMQDHQKYFPVTDSKGKPRSMFVAISNIKSKSPKRVRQGNERVLRARLADARFFWDTDQKEPLADKGAALEGVLFHNKLGTIRDKVERLQKLALYIAAATGTDRDQVKEAASLCKNDLVTDMVGEFPELQGVIGRYYAINQGISRPVANAIAQHYLPRFSGDEIPRKPVGQCLALADRIDTLVGIFACNEIPTGDKDPYGLRRAALGVIRILVEKKISLDLPELLAKSMAIYRAAELDDIATGEDEIHGLRSFITERMKGYFVSRGFSAEQFAAVDASSPVSPSDYLDRFSALQRFFSKRRGAAESLAAANKRIANILEKSEDGEKTRFSRKLLRDPAEKTLADALRDLGKSAKDDFSNARYESGLTALAQLRQPVDEFFDQVMVNHEDPAVRQNRLALLREIRVLFMGVSDISRIRLDT